MTTLKEASSLTTDELELRIYIHAVCPETIPSIPPLGLGDAMTESACSDELLLQIANLYYVDGLPQTNVARLANVSQAKVSRLLARAREKGLVRITVAEYNPRDHELEEQLISRLGLRQAVVVKTANGLNALELRQSLTHFAAPVVAGWIPANGTLAIAGGRTMQWLIHNMTAPPGAEGLTVVQSMGNIDASAGPYDALELGRILAQRWCGKLFILNTPAILPDSRTRKTLLGLASVRSVMEQLREVQAALVGVGTLHNSVFVERGVLTNKDTAQLARAGAVGEICGRFYDRDGNECQTSFRDRVISIELADLRRVDQVIALVAGSDRTDAIIGALRGGLLKSLVIDRAGAAALLEHN